MSGQAPAGAQSLAATAILQVRKLRVSYGKVEALHDASLRVGAGQIATVIGPTLFATVFAWSIRDGASWHFPGSAYALAGLLLVVAAIIAERATRPQVPA